MSDTELDLLNSTARDIADRINEHFASVMPRDPRWRYFEVGQWKYCWTTEGVDGVWQSFMFKPEGKGARDPRGGWRAETWVIRSIVEHRTRRAAKARAARLYNSAKAKR